MYKYNLQVIDNNSFLSYAREDLELVQVSILCIFKDLNFRKIICLCCCINFLSVLRLSFEVLHNKPCNEIYQIPCSHFSGIALMSVTVTSFPWPTLLFFHNQPVYRPLCPGHQMPLLLEMKSYQVLEKTS